MEIGFERIEHKTNLIWSLSGLHCLLIILLRCRRPWTIYLAWHGSWPFNSPSYLEVIRFVKRRKTSRLKFIKTKPRKLMFAFIYHLASFASHSIPSQETSQLETHAGKRVYEAFNLIKRETSQISRLFASLKDRHLISPDIGSFILGRVTVQRRRTNQPWNL